MITDTAFTVRAREFEPAYLRLGVGAIERRAEEAIAALSSCQVCPRNCRVDRLRDKTAVCKSGRYALVGSHFPHFGEEDCLRGWNGSGTIFFSWCNLRCVFCLHPDTLVATDQGLVRIGELFEQTPGAVEWHGGWVRFVHGKVGVATRTAGWAPVAKVFCHHFAGDLIRVKPFNCPPLLLTPNHEVFAVPKTGPSDPVRVRAEDLKKDYYLVVPKHSPGGLTVELNVHDLLSAGAPRLQASPGRRHLAEELAQLFSEPRTSRELAAITGYHPAYVRKLRGQWRRDLLPRDAVPKAAVVIEEGGRVRFRVERRPGIPARLTLDERLAWLLGIYCAEGHSTSQKGRPNSHRLIFSFGRRETGLVERTRRLLADLFAVHPRVYARRTTVTVEVGKASLALLFVHLCGKSARGKQVPPQLAGAARNVVRAFLQGVVDGDGCDRGTHVVVNTVSERLAAGLFGIGLLLGMLPSFHRWDAAPKTVIEGREVNQAPLYYVKFPKEDPRSGKRHSRWQERNDYFLVPIHKVTRVPYDGPVFNLEVDDLDHSYVASFVAVSNCQNFDISQKGEGAAVSPERLAGMMLELQARGCHNINFVTPEHVVPQILEALPLAIRGGLRLPIVYNTSAYDSLESLRWMDWIVDIYMPDFKVWDGAVAKRYLKAPD
ncbi:MAG: hypothetical protein HY613_06650, partial [Candidatus Rokubacteria bacterium]|nr:hypothetical protein [Candidatus Rokubacteria bacterium]